MAKGIEDVDRNALVKEEDNQKYVSVECRDVKSVVSLGIGNERVCAMLKKEVDGIVMTSLSGPLERCSDRVSSFLVNLGAVFDEELAHGKLVVDRSPLGIVSVPIRMPLWQ